MEKNNKNRPVGVGTVSQARREKMRQKALAKEAKAKEEEEARRQQPADSSWGQAPAGSGLNLGPSDAQKVKETPCLKGKGAEEEPAAGGTPCQKESSADFGGTSSSSTSSSPLQEQKKQKLEEDKKEKHDPLPKGEGKQDPLPKEEGQQDPLPKGVHPLPKGGGRWVLKAESRLRVMVDWYQTLELPGGHVPQASLEALKLLKQHGFQVFIVSFCGPTRQREVERKVNDLGLAVDGLFFTRRKGGIGGKGEWCLKNRIGHCVDDSWEVLEDSLAKGVTVWPITTKFEKHDWLVNRGHQVYSTFAAAVEELLLRAVSA